MIRAVLLAIFLPVVALAQDGPRVEVTLAPEGPITVGTTLEVTAVLLVPTFMPQPPVWPDLQIADAITRLSDQTSRPLTRQIGGESWTGVIRRYLITPQRAAEFAFPPANVAVTYADPQTSAPVQTEVAFPDLSFTAALPAGAEGLDPFVAASALTVTETMEGPGDDPKPGSAVTLTVTTEAKGTQAMLLPSLLAGRPVPQGLRAYPRQPELVDEPGERGEAATAKRVESVTYVVETPGDYQIPGLQLDWWSTSRNAVQSAASAPVNFNVPAPPGWKPPRSAEEIAQSRHRAILIGSSLLAVLVACLLLYRPAVGALQRWQARRAVSEPVLFRGLLHLAQQGDIARLRLALPAWKSDAPSPALETALRNVERGKWGAVQVRPDPKPLVAALHAERGLHHAPSKNVAQLPPLNPWQEKVS